MSVKQVAINATKQQLMAQMNLLGGIYLGDNVETPVSFSYDEKSLVYHGILIPDYINNFATGDTDSLKNFMVRTYGFNAKACLSTFFKNVDAVSEMSSESYYFHQMLHYLSTYGGFSEIANSGMIYEPNPLSGREVALLDKTEFKGRVKEIRVLNRDEYREAVLGLVSENKAYSSSDLSHVMTNALNNGIDFSGVKVACREARTILLLKGVLSCRDLTELVSVSVFAYTGETMIVKSTQFYRNLGLSVKNFFYAQYRASETVEVLFKKFVEEHGVDKIAVDSNRYRKILLILRNTSPVVKKIINKALKRAKKVSQPFVAPVSQRMFDKNTPLSDKISFVEKADLKTLLRLLESNRERSLINSELEREGTATAFYKIRNNKEFYSEESKSKTLLSNELVEVINKRIKILGEEYLSDLIYEDSDGVRKVFILGGFNYPLNYSGKTCLGNIPEGTTFSFRPGDFNGNVLSVGVYWDFQSDIDLHAVNRSGRQIGWNSNFRSDAGGCPVYSGDMTNLNSEGFASEFIAFKDLDSFSEMDSYDLSIKKYGYYDDTESGVLKLVVSTGSSDVGDFMNIDNIVLQVPIALGIQVKNLTDLGRVNVSRNERGEILVTVTGRGGENKRTPSEYSAVRAEIMPRRIALKVTVRELLDSLGIKVVDVNGNTEIPKGARVLDADVLSGSKMASKA